MKKKPMLATFLLLISIAAPASSQPGWELIGERTVDRGAGREEIEASPIVYASHLRLCADRHAIRFHDVDVLYRNGNRQQVSVRSDIPAGRCTPDIALSNAGQRDIDRVALSYRADGGEPRRPRVYVFALAGRVLR